MAQKILLDMIKLRSVLAENHAIVIPEGIFTITCNSNGFKSIQGACQLSGFHAGDARMLHA